VQAAPPAYPRDTTGRGTRKAISGGKNTATSDTAYTYDPEPGQLRRHERPLPVMAAPVRKAACKAAVWATEYGIEALAEVFCGSVATMVFALCSAIVTGLSSAASYYVETRWDGGFSWGEAISNLRHRHRPLRDRRRFRPLRHGRAGDLGRGHGHAHRRGLGDRLHQIQDAATRTEPGLAASASDTLGRPSGLPQLPPW
jgi:hypothetical protein